MLSNMKLDFQFSEKPFSEKVMRKKIGGENLEILGKYGAFFRITVRLEIAKGPAH